MTKPAEQRTDLVSSIRDDDKLMQDFSRICDCGGRVAGSPSEENATRFLETSLSRISGGRLEVQRNDHLLWETERFYLKHVSSGEDLVCIPLLGTAPTPPGGLVREVVDLGFGRPEDFNREGHAVAGRIALVRHEYPFMADHIHRDTKARMAEACGAHGFLIAHQEYGVGPVSGSSSGRPSEGIASFGIGAEAAARLSKTGNGYPLVKMLCIGHAVTRKLPTLILTLPGECDDIIVVSAHIDGHSLGESAIDNGTGLACALALARAVAGQKVRLQKTVQVCLFSAEEWDLGGSRRWLDSLTTAERQNIVLNINLDAVGGDDFLTALTSEFENLPTFVKSAASMIGSDIEVFQPLKDNSDHFNFAEFGIPAFRLLAGFERPASALRFLLTAQDRRGLVTPRQLQNATLVAGAVLMKAINAPREEMKSLRNRTTKFMEKRTG